MPFRVVAGALVVVGASPDGDSIRFLPDDPDLINSLPGPPAKPATRFQLRLEGIDALETHYVGRRQPVKWARAARDFLIAFAGIENVVWDSTQSTIVSASDQTRAWILCREREKYGRPVAFLFRGDPPQGDGSDILLDVTQLEKSYNHEALLNGLAYPTFYEGLFFDLRQKLTAAVASARAAGLGLWPEDRTTAGFDARDMSAIIDEHPILPKLFRRLSDYMAATGGAAGFKEALAASQEGVWDLLDQNKTHFDTFVEQASGSTLIRMTRLPEQLVFDTMPTKPANAFAAMVGAPGSGEMLVET